MKYKIIFSLFMAVVFFATASFPAFALESKNEIFTIKKGILLNYNGQEEHVIIPNGVTKIGEKAFWKNTTIQSVVIPEGVTEIGREAFWNCISLSEIQIPSTAINPGGERTYDLTPWLETQLAALPETAPFLVINQVLVAARKDLKTAVKIPEGVIKITDYGLSETKFTSITIAASVIEIGDHAFQMCYYRPKLYMPASVFNSHVFYKELVKNVYFMLL